MKNLEYYPYTNLNLKVTYSLDKLNKIKEKYQNKTTRINIRKSGTENIIRVNINSKNKETLDSIIKEIKEYE